MRFLDEVFQMGGGYVLDFSDRTMREFFADELNVDIDDPAYSADGRSKAKRLRCFLRTVDLLAATRAINALWEYREVLRQQNGGAESVVNAAGRLLELVARLNGSKNEDFSGRGSPPIQAFAREHFVRLKSALWEIFKLDPQAKGYAFEKFLKELFDSFGLNAKEPFRIRGEQIDGSFILAAHTYLVEAKWQAQPTGAADLHVFQGKLDQKASWARGLFISYSGFTAEGLDAFGRGKKVICMDGGDLNECLQREVPLSELLDRKDRWAVETGRPYVPFNELFR
ncbi:restriction endonuclease [Luteolibacter sp. Populi]|uniref:restriction endonuclease n=1 Tax=Luteolibacter sp. Populi TaxID=3230487 RepID=UPI003466B8D1